MILLNNDTEVFQDFVERLYEGICKRKNAFACSAKLISYQERDKIDDAGNYYNMLGWHSQEEKENRSVNLKRPTGFCGLRRSSDLPPGISGKDRTF